MDDPRVLKEARKTDSVFPVIITGHPNSDLVNEAIRCSPVLLMAKPLNKSKKN